MGWTPEEGFHAWDWHGYDEAMIVYLLALGSPTHPIDPKSWDVWTSTYKWGTFQGQEHLNFSPLFVHQFSHVWVDFRGIQDAYMRGKGIDYFENARRATLSQRAYAIANPGGFAGYGPNVWGLTACDGPLDAVLEVGGRSHKFQTYAARGASIVYVLDDGTIAPTAAAGSIAFAPEIVVPALREMARRWGSDVWNAYGFIDAFNPTLGELLGRAALRAHRAGRRLVRPGPARHRPGAHRRHARELPFRARLEDHAPQSLHRGGLEARGVHGRMARNARALTLALACLAAAGCARKAAAPGEQVLRFWGLGREGEVVKDLVPEFERENPGIRVVVQQIPWTAAHEKLLTGFVGGSPPDLAQLGNTWIPEFAAIGALEPLDARVAASKALAPADYYEGIWKTNGFGGATYGIPWYVDTRVLFYRKDLLKAAGYAAMPRTWSGWREAMRRIKGATRARRYAILLPTNEWEQVTIFGLQERSPLLADGRHAGRLRAARFRRATDWYISLYTQGLAPVVSYTQLGNPVPGVQPRLRRHVDHRARGTSASSAGACRPSCRTPG